MQRRYDIDWLRTIIVLSIIPFHAFVIFNQKEWAIFYVKDTVNVAAFNFIESIIDRFNMVTLFLLAGMSSYFSLQRRSSDKFLSDRFKKCLLPTIAGCILLNPVMTYLHCLNIGLKESFVAHYIGFFTKNPGELDGLNGGFTPAHLWFILYLFLFSLIGLPLFMWLNSEKTRKLRENLASLFSKPMAILLLIIPYGFIYLIELLDDKNPIAYFYVVIVGFLFASDEKYMQALIRDRRKYYFLTIILYIIFFKCAPSSEANMMVTYFYEYLALTLKMVSSIALLILFNRHINKNTKILKYLSKASFTVYVVHMLILTAVSFAVVRFAVPPVVKFFIMVIVSYIISFAVYELLKRTLFQLPFLKSNAGR